MDLCKQPLQFPFRQDVIIFDLYIVSRSDNKTQFSPLVDLKSGCGKRYPS